MSDVAVMRADFRRIGPWLITQGWTEAEVAELGDAVRVCIASGKSEDIALWAAWLARQAAELDALAVLCRAAEQRIRMALERQKKRAA